MTGAAFAAGAARHAMMPAVSQLRINAARISVYRLSFIVLNRDGRLVELLMSEVCVFKTNLSVPPMVNSATAGPKRKEAVGRSAFSPDSDLALKRFAKLAPTCQDQNVNHVRHRQHTACSPRRDVRQQ